MARIHTASNGTSGAMSPDLFAVVVEQQAPNLCLSTKVKNQSDFEWRSPQIIQELRFMSHNNCFGCFQFQKYAVIDHQVGAEITYIYAAKEYRHRYLNLDLQILCTQCQVE